MVSPRSSRSDIQAVLAEGGAVELVLDVTRFSDGEAAGLGTSRDVGAHRPRAALREAQGDIVLTFDREALGQVADDVEAHGLRETALVLAVAATGSRRWCKRRG